MRGDARLELPQKDLVSLVKICRKDSRFLDGLWFMNIEDRFGFEEAMKIHCEMWGQFGRYQARLIKAAFDLGDDPISALVMAVDLDPAWLLWDYTIGPLSGTEALFRVTGCKAQQVRIKIGRGINPHCQKTDGAYFTSFARALDPLIRVRCDIGPPERYSDNLWCEWKFYIEEDTIPNRSSHKRLGDPVEIS